MKRYFIMITFITVSLLTGCAADLTESGYTYDTFNVLQENAMNSSAIHKEEYNGFQLSTFDSGEGVLIYTYEYYDTAVDLSIRMNNDGLYSTIYHNDKKLDINTYGHFYDNGSNGYALPYLIDVTGDGQEELILEYASPDPSGVPYLIHKCYVYRLDTMEQLHFNIDTTDLANMMTIKPLEYNDADNIFSFQIEYDTRLFGSDTRFHEAWEKTIFSTTVPNEQQPDMTNHPVYISPDFYMISYYPPTSFFSAKFYVYTDSTCSDPLDPIYIEFFWDETSNQFIMNLDTAMLQMAG